MRESTHPGFPLGLPLSQEAWQGLDIRGLLQSGALGRNQRLRLLAARANQSALRAGGRHLHPGELITLVLIHEAFRYVATRYFAEEQPGVLGRGLARIDAAQGTQLSRACAESFAICFPSAASRLPTDEAAREMLLLSIVVGNPAATPYRVLFRDTRLRSESAYELLLAQLQTFLAQQASVRGRQATLLPFLREPILAHPDSLADQLAFILAQWADLLPDWLLELLLTAQGILREEQTTRRTLGAGSLETLSFGGGALYEPERFTPDRDWMANVVLMAKSTYVWLDQLSRKWNRPIVRLDQIPDEELDAMARWGFTGLWLIGLWERSSTSEEIKRRMGNPEAVASAYSLYDYVVANDLGGEGAYDDLSRRAWARGIRLAADMVPNHVGVYSKWVIENPDRFLQVDHPPYPAYRFTGPDLSRTPGVGIRIEDGYWTHSDAAVVFERVDYDSGRRRYIYHGNDGTSMPWNDTAQLDYLNPDVREAIIQTILHVARKFSIIRFDAAMTLANRHIQRLWYPAPGDGGAIPSRAERGMSRERFAELMPREFWRDVVDRIQAELPDTLLLAEAFWLMEGYFVRTLGMHRVYNSAFMNMLKMEENAKYRQTLKNVLEYSPQVLKRFVNFMSNPDERTAVEQFGKGDKYFGNALLLVTLPGLPMFAHGQVEGFTERYGMEYRRAYWDEKPDEGLMARHERELFPLMRKRYLFSQVENFALYDFEHADGGIDENVFAYSNTAFGERALVVFHNAYRDTRGTVRSSTAINVGSADSPNLVRRSLAEALGLRSDEGTLYIVREHFAQLEYLRYGHELAHGGLHVALGGYGVQVFIDWRELADADALWHRLAAKLAGSGVPSMELARRELELEPITHAFAALVRTMRAGEPAGEALTLFLERAGVKEAAPVMEALALATDGLTRLSALSPRAALALEKLCGTPSSVMANLLVVLRALPAGAALDWRLEHLLAAMFDRAELVELLPLILAPRDDRELVDAAHALLRVNRWEGVDWFNGERMQLLLEGQRLSRLAALLGDAEADEAAVEAAWAAQEKLQAAVEASSYKLAELLLMLPASTPETPPPPVAAQTSAPSSESVPRPARAPAARKSPSKRAGKAKLPAKKSPAKKPSANKTPAKRKK